MTPLEMIAEWRRGCSCARNSPAECVECTEAFVSAIEAAVSWMPIATAPRGGKPVLIWANGGPHIAEWELDYDNPAHHSWNTNEVAGSGGTICYQDGTEATHWKPIDPPA